MDRARSTKGLGCAWRWARRGEDAREEARDEVGDDDGGARLSELERGARGSR